MKRCWIGCGILVLILILGILSAGYLENRCDQVARELSRAAEGEAPEANLAGAREQWTRGEAVASLLLDQGNLASLDRELALLDPAAPDFPDRCRNLALQFKALGLSQRITLGNLF